MAIDGEHVIERHGWNPFERAFGLPCHPIHTRHEAVGHAKRWRGMEREGDVDVRLHGSEP